LSGARVTSRYDPTSHSVADWVPRTALSRIPAATKKGTGGRATANGQTEGTGGGKAEQIAEARGRAITKPLSRMSNCDRRFAETSVVGWVAACDGLRWGPAAILSGVVLGRGRHRCLPCEETVPWPSASGLRQAHRMGASHRIVKWCVCDQNGDTIKIAWAQLCRFVAETKIKIYITKKMT